MIRIEELQDGVLHIHGEETSEYRADPKELPADVYEKYLALRATDPSTRIEGVGWHLERNSYWIFQQGDDIESIERRLNATTKMTHMVQQVLNYKPTYRKKPK